MPFNNLFNMMNAFQSGRGNFQVGQQYGGMTYKDWGDTMVKDWTTDSTKGDKGNFTIKDGQVYYPIWKQESEVAGEKVSQQAEQFLDPNSSYYRKINEQIRNSLSGAFNSDSLLALTVAMGGSPAQAQEQIKAEKGRIGDLAGRLSNQYYLNASSQGTNLLGASLQNAQYQEELRHQLEQYRDAQRANSLNQGLSLGFGVLGSWAGSGFKLGG